MARSISPASRTSTGLNSTPNDGATDWMAANCPTPAAMAGSRRTAARVTRGAISLSNSSHFALMPYSNRVKPVALPPGRARLVDEAGADRIGDLHEHDRHGAGRLQQRPHDRAAGGQDDVRRERDQFRRVSANTLGIAPAPAVSICTLRPSIQPNCCSPAGTPQCGPGLPDRPRPAHEHADAPHSARAAARAPRAATPPPYRQA